MSNSVTPVRVLVLAGGLGAARFLTGLVQVVAPEEVTAIVNVGDDLTLHGLHISPDLDTVTYTLADEVNPETGWGRRDETWNAMATVRQLGGPTWFQLGDRDLGTHLYRTGRLAAGADLQTVTAEIVAGFGLGVRLLPVTNDRLRTRVTIAGEAEVDFQDYFVARRHSVPVSGVRFDGVDTAAPGPGVLEAIDGADVVVIAPSNPIVSIGPVLAVRGVRNAVVARRDDTVAVSPIVGGAALRGPADRLLAELGHEPSVVGVARLYAPVASVLVIDEIDADLASAVEAEGLRCVITPTVMRDRDVAAALAGTTIGSVT